MPQINSSLTALKRLSREAATGEDHAILFAQLSVDPSDRAVAIIGGTLLEGELEQLLLSHMVELSDEDYNKMFVGHGPASSFSAKIQLGYALGYYDRKVVRTLDIIKDIRNAFAHGKKALVFKHEVVNKCCKLLTLFEDSEDHFDPVNKGVDSARHRYLNHVAKLTTYFAEMSTEVVLNKTYAIGMAPDNYTPGSFPRSVKIEQEG